MLSFQSLLSQKTAKGKAAASSLKVGDAIKPTIRGDGGKGLVLVIGRVTNADGKYASKKAPIAVSVSIKTKDGETATETFNVTDADGCHLGAVERVERAERVERVERVERAEVDAMLAQIETMTVTEIK